jgi:hypothetical protein
MHPHHLIGSLAQDRHAARYSGSHSGAHEGGHGSSENRETARRRVGWLLVGLGLRLISSQSFGGDARAAQRARLIGQ